MADETKKLAQIDAAIKGIDDNKIFQQWVAGKRLADERAELQKERARLELKISRDRQVSREQRAANADPAWHEYLSELYPERIRTYDALKTQEVQQKNWLGGLLTTHVLSNERFVEARVEAINDAILKVKELQCSEKPVDAEREIEKIRASIPPWSSLSRTEKIAVAPQPIRKEEPGHVFDLTRAD